MIDRSVYTRPTKFEDLSELIENLRDEDRAEIIASHGGEKIAVLYSFINSRICETAFNGDGEVVCVYGIQVIGETLACPWMLSTDKLPEVAFAFLRGSKKWITRMNESYCFLMNVVDANYTTSLRWLSFLGFEVTQAIESYGVNPTTFLQVTKLRGK
jgi:hypothetical protein